MSILLAGIPSEAPIALAAESAAALGIDCIMLNQRAFAYDDIELAVTNGRCHGVLKCGMQDHAIESFSGIYSRHMPPDSLPECNMHGSQPASPMMLKRARSWSDIVTAWTECAPIRVANRPSSGMSNFSKPYQCQLIRKAGLKTPETLVTNDPDAVCAFNARHGRIIYKSTSGVRSIVKVLDGAAMQRLEQVRHLPTQFQEFVAGDNVRVHVVKENTFATRIVSEAIDYRYAAHEGLEVDMNIMVLPETIEASCIALAKILGLAFCGIDFKLTAEGEFVCFEVNTSPAYSYYQEQTGLAISDALVSYLAGRD